ncbi:MAG: hypothetical protein AMXMBFR36_15490 [Acidobacteriota bacterium]
MTPAQAEALRQLVETQRIAALGTLHDGEPWVSMVPFALLPGAAGFVVHVSALASHTADMSADPRVSLLIVAAERDGAPPQARARVTVRGRAEQLAHDSSEHAAAREAYLARFPQAAGILGLGDFSFFVIRPLAARVVGGFAQAETLTADQLVAALVGA